MIKAHEFQDRRELVSHLQQRKLTLSKHFEERIDSLKEIVYKSVEGNTFRAFHRMRRRPSEVFRNWAIEQLNEGTIEKINRISSEQEYDGWLREFSGNLCQYWKNEMSVDIPYGPGRKLPNLLMKTFILWNGLKDSPRTRLTKFLHVPLDNYTLVTIRNCTSDFPQAGKIITIPKNSTMSFVKNEAIYNSMQQIIKGIAKQADVPPIYLDVLAWDEQH